MRCSSSRLLSSVFCVFVSSGIFAAEYYIDPQKGATTNNGSAEKPWKSLQAVIDAKMVESSQWEKLPYKEGAKLVQKNPGAIIKPGDTLWLRSGNYGPLRIQGYYNSETITIAAEKGHTPQFNSILIRSGSHWTLKGLHITPVPGEKKQTLIYLQSHGYHGPVSDMSVEECTLKSTEESAGWTAEDWNKRACTGINADGTRMIIRGNILKNVDSGINVGASHAIVENNSVINFCGDGMRGLGDHSLFQYNLIKNCYDVNDNHDDAFQSWSSGKNGIGSGEVVGIVLRGNTIINYEDPDQAHRGTLQGIGCFDGMYRDWIIENNLIVVDHWHGITLMGAENCRIVNNTVVDCNSERPGPPSIRPTAHKKGAPAKGCIVRNNLATSISTGKGIDMVEDHNLVVKDMNAVFVNPDERDYQLKSGSPAIDRGSNELAPETDILKRQRPQGRAIDIGAYESR